MKGWLVLGITLAVALAGCSATVRGQSALRQGYYAEAASEFEEALEERPERLDALIGLGIARYKLGSYDTAVEILDEAVARAPREGHARLYLGLAHLQRGEIDRAVEHLRSFRETRPDPRVAAQVDRSLALLADPGLPASVRAFMAASLEEQTALARDLREARDRPPAYAYGPLWYGPGWPFYYDCVAVRRGRVVCF